MDANGLLAVIDARVKILAWHSDKLLGISIDVPPESDMIAGLV